MATVGMVGLGRLGLPVAVCLAQKYRVVGYDVNPALMTKRKYEYREAGIEPGTDFQSLFDRANLHFGSLEEVFAQCNPVFLCIQTPHQPQFEGTTPLPVERADFDYSYLEACARQVAPLVRPDQTVSVISTVLPGTMSDIVVPHLGNRCHLIYNPFFPAMGTCCSDFMNPEFILLGGTERATLAMAEFYRDFYGIRLITEHRPILTMSYESAELSKVAYNCFISAKIAIANCLMEIAHKTPGCHVDDVSRTLSCATRRLLSPKYLAAGMGDGGGCHPRDLIAMSWLSDQLDLSYDAFGMLADAREAQTEWLADLIASYWVTTRLRPVLLGKSFKPESNITTGSPAILLANILKARGIGPFDHYDPYDMGDEQYLSKFWFDGPRLFFIACKHQCYQNWVFPTGSVVLDPHRYIKQQPGVEVVHIGVGK